MPRQLPLCRLGDVQLLRQSPSATGVACERYADNTWILLDDYQRQLFFGTPIESYNNLSKRVQWSDSRRVYICQGIGAEMGSETSLMRYVALPYREVVVAAPMNLA